MNKIINEIKHPDHLLMRINYRFPQLCRWMDDETCLKFWYRITIGKKLDLENPTSFNEKLQWLKLYDRKPIYTTMVDKCKAKKYVANIIGDEYIIPTLGVWDKFDDIDFSKLPDQFVLKCTHDSGGLVICKDKSSLNINEARKKINRSLKRNFYWVGREWPYKNVKPRIIAEKYMVDESGYELKDYKFFCFDGFAKAMFIASDRQVEGEDTKFDFFDMDFKHLQFTNGHPNSTNEIKRPESFEHMRELAEKLSKGIPHVRVDFYDINGQVYFGELTFAHWSGFVSFEPEEWDRKFGEWIKLPNSLGGGYLIAGKGFILYLHSIQSTNINDYKIHVFNGEPKFILVCSERNASTGVKEDFYDSNWNKMKVCRPWCDNSINDIPKPKNLQLMLKLATELSDKSKFLRVDFYEVGGRIYFGELTLYPASGFERFIPEYFDLQMGKWLDIK